jgi:hypothetical protein
MKTKTKNETQETQKFDEWAMLELFGHQRLAGRVTEATIGGASFVRVDVPDGKGWKLTRMLNPAAIYSITPVTEEMARAAATHIQCEPITRYDVTELIKRGTLKLPGATVEFEE